MTSRLDAVQTIVMARAEPGKILVFRDRAVGELAGAIAGSHQDVVVVVQQLKQKKNDSAASPAKFQRVQGDHFSLIDQLSAPISGGFDLVVAPWRSYCAKDLQAAFAVWQHYLAPGGRILLRAHRDLAPRYQDGSTARKEEDCQDAKRWEHWEQTVRRYRRAGRCVGMRLIEVNGLPFGRRFERHGLSPEDLAVSLGRILQSADHLLKAGYESEAKSMQTTATVWRSRLLANDLGYLTEWPPLQSLQVKDFLKGQARLFVTFRKQVKEDKTDETA